MPSYREPSVCRRLLALVLMAPLASLASGLTGNETISTVAGTGLLTSTGDGAPATAATLSVYHLQLGRSGDLYVADPVGSRVRRIDAAGIISTVAGDGTPGYSGDNGPASQARLAEPLGVAVDSQGNLYIAERDNSRIRRVAAATGIITTFAGDGSYGFAGDGGPAANAKLRKPYSVTLAPDGSIYIADSENYRIRKVDAAGNISTVAGNGVQAASGGLGDGGPALQASFGLPVDVAFDAAGNVYVLDALWKRVRRIDAAGNIQTHAGGGTFSADGTPGTQFQFNLPGRGIAVDSFGNVFVSDQGIDAKFVYKIDAAAPNAVTRVAGSGASGFTGDGGPARLAQLQGGNGLEFDAQGNLYVGDFGRIRRIAAAPAYALSQFVAFGDNLLLIGRRSHIASGAVGANRRATNSTPEVLMRGPVRTYPAFFAIGDTVMLEGANIPEVRSRDPVQLRNGAAVGVQQTVSSFPLLSLPALQAANPEMAASGDVIVAPGQARSLAPGRYRRVTVGEGATLNLQGFIHIGDPPGTPRGYDFRSIELKDGAKILFGAPSVNLTSYPLGVQVRVQLRMRAGARTVIGPASELGGLNGSHIVFHVGGGDVLALPPQNLLLAASIGRNSSVRANIYAPNGTVRLDIGVRGTGAFVGRIFAGDAVRLILESAFQP